PQQDKVRAMAVGPDGKVLVVAGGTTARFWDLTAREPIGPPLHHNGEVAAVALSPDGGTAVTGSVAGQAHLWNVATGQCLGAPLLHRGAVRVVAFSPDGRTVLTG